MFPSSYHHEIFRIYYQWPKQGQCKRSRSKVKVTEVTTQLNRFRTVTPVWIHIWWWNDAYSLMLLRRGALLFFKGIRQISRSHGSKNCRIWPKLGVSRLYLLFGIINGYEMMHKAWSSIEEVPYCFSMSSIKFQGHTGQNITDFDSNWAFPDYRPVAAFKSLRFALFKVIRQISRSHRTINHRFWPELSVSGL